MATFYIGKAICGIDILKVQEINRQTIQMTRVPQAQEYISGVLNLRGRIVTVMDLGRKLGLSPTELSDDSRNIIVNSQNEHIGLLVDRISDVVPADRSEILPPPSNVGGVQGKYFEGVFQIQQGLIAVLDIEEVLKVEEH